ncbi:MAG: hypothetical protein JO298_09010 [Verrucomicrobia bacterium]|nr:hypothetical protein [Verrucomicrobiota bacterium]
MAKMSGGTLLQSRKGPVSERSHGSAVKCAPTLDALNEQVIILRRDDIGVDVSLAPAVDWSAFDKGEIAVQLRDTEGLAEGSVAIKASTLKRIHPALLPTQLEKEYFFPISLKTVVLQLQTHMRRITEEPPNPVPADFDTPIAQVAREDEGFFKLAKAAEQEETAIVETAQEKRKTSGPVLTPADRPASAGVRRKSSTGDTSSEPSLRSFLMVPVPPKSAGPETVSGQAECAGSKTGAIEQSALRRRGLERLQEIFMTEDKLNAHQVANLLSAFPKVTSAMVLGDGRVLGGNLPDDYDLETALLAPKIMRSVRAFNPRLKVDEISAFTLLGDRPVTLFAYGNVYILISHEGRGLLPGMRERIGEVARALDELCGG